MAGQRQPVTTLSRKNQTIKAVEHERQCLLTKTRATHISPVGKDPDQRVTYPVCIHTIYGCTWATEPDGHACTNQIQVDETQIGQVIRKSSCFTKVRLRGVVICCTSLRDCSVANQPASTLVYLDIFPGGARGLSDAAGPHSCSTAH